MDSNNQNEALIQSFSEITSATRDEAVFFLESHNYDLDSAVSTFFDSSANNPNPNLAAFSAAVVADAQPVRPLSESPVTTPESDSESPPRSPYHLRSGKDKLPMASSSASAARGVEKEKGKKSGGRQTGIRTFSDLGKQDESGSDSDEHQEYYTGGEKSGMLVQGPPKPRNVDSIFDQARQAGAAHGHHAEPVPPSSSSRSFTGTGRLLSGETVSQDLQPPEPLNYTIYFWRNGFSVNDGPLRRMDDPQNGPFLQSIMRSECPKELEPADRRISVNCSLVKRDEDFKEPEQPKLPFQGVGRTLGSSSSDAPASEPPASAAPLSAAPLPSMGLVIDQNAPLTSIQIRLADGTRMVSRFNHHHTIGHIRAFINASRPGTATNYQLQLMEFPPKPLTDPSLTIEQAGLANSVVIQRF